MNVDWEDLRAFLAVMEQGSLSAAARWLRLAQPTVRRRIEVLEETLATPLFTRATNGLIPTERAHALKDYAKEMAHAADALVRTASSGVDEVAGTVRVTASEVIAIEVLPPILAKLARLHPALAIELSPSNRNQDILRREADVAVRMATPQQDALVARRIGAVPLGLHAHPAYFEGREIPTSHAQLITHRLIGIEHETPLLDAVRSRGFAVRVSDFLFRSDSDLAQLAAIRSGIGIGLCQVPLAQRAGLVRVLPQQLEFDLETWVVCHEDLRAVARVRAVFDALVTGLGEYIGARNAGLSPA
jgi:DNA-binding transcriptional LysR family regulator